MERKVAELRDASSILYVYARFYGGGLRRKSNMKINGYKLRETLKMKGLELGTIQTQFDESLFVFEGQEKESPKVIAEKIAKLEGEIAKLQAAQSYYNLEVMVKVEEQEMPLEAAIKLVGGAGRLSKMWRTAAQGQKKERWDRGFELARNKDSEFAKPTVTKLEALEYAKAAEKFAAALRNAIAIGNNTIVVIDWIDESLFNL